MKLSGRLRVGGGIFLALFLTLNLAAEAPPPKLVAASTELWRFSIVTTAGEVALTHDYSECGTLSAAKITLPAGGANVLRKPVVCVYGFAMLDAPAAPASAETVVTFNDGMTAASFTIPAVGALYDDTPAQLARPLIVDAEEGSWITVIPQYNDTPLYVVLRNAANLAAAPVIETFRAKLPITQYQVQASGIWWAEVYLGTDPTYRCFPAKTCEGVYGAVYGFGSTGTTQGGSVRISPF
jgi:hypothetical protein